MKWSDIGTVQLVGESFASECSDPVNGCAPWFSLDKVYFSLIYQVRLRACPPLPTSTVPSTLPQLHHRTITAPPPHQPVSSPHLSPNYVLRSVMVRSSSFPSLRSTLTLWYPTSSGLPNSRGISSSIPSRWCRSGRSGRSGMS